MSDAPFTLDPFQRAAIDALARDESVLVSAPTGAGKTVVADAAIDRALATGRRAIYTTPLKALSNQKHRDLAARLGPERVGLLTGDRSHRPDADVVVMTTEIVRALLHAASPLLADVAVLVLDEFHYLRDPERGSVWEEIVIDAPSHLQLVCLSATMPEARRVHAWLERVHPPTALVIEEHRPIPLHHLYTVGNLQDEPPLLLPMFDGAQISEVAVRHDGVRNTTRGEGRRVRDVRRPVTPRRATLLEALRADGLIPAIWFMLSRGGCERAVDELLTAGVSFNDPDEAWRARDMADAAMARLPQQDQRVIDPTRWRAAFEHGIATHHGGLLPLQREAVEHAFAAGLLKVIFATETLAVGVNLPARTTVIDRVMRPESQGGELLAGDEFAQLAGRAGRRGLDDVGYAVVPWAPDVAFYRVAGLAGGAPGTLESQLQCTPTMVASLAHRFGSLAEALEHLDRSLFAHLMRDRQQVLVDERDARQLELDELLASTPRVADDAPPSRAAPAEPAEPAEPDATATTTALARLAPGDIVVDPARPRPLLVLAVRAGRRGEPAVDVLAADGRRIVVTSRDFRRPAAVVGAMTLEGWDPRVRGQAREAARRLAEAIRTKRLDQTERAPLPAPATARTADGKRIRRLRDLVADLDSRIAAQTDALPREFAATTALLLRRRHLVEPFRPTTSGSLLRRIYHPQGLLVAEALAAGLFDGLSPVELAGVTAAFRAGAGDRSLGLTTTSSRQVTVRLRTIAARSVEVNRDEASLDRPLTQPVDALFVDAMMAWAGGDGLAAALDGVDGLPGDFLREVRQTIELLDQIRASAEDRAVAEAAASAMSLIDRDAARIGLLEEVVT